MHDAANAAGRPAPAAWVRERADGGERRGEVVQRRARAAQRGEAREAGRRGQLAQQARGRRGVGRRRRVLGPGDGQPAVAAGPEGHGALEVGEVGQGLLEAGAQGVDGGVVVGRPDWEEEEDADVAPGHELVERGEDGCERGHLSDWSGFCLLEAVEGTVDCFTVVLLNIEVGCLPLIARAHLYLARWLLQMPRPRWSSPSTSRSPESRHGRSGSDVRPVQAARFKILLINNSHHMKAQIRLPERSG